MTNSIIARTASQSSALRMADIKARYQAARSESQCRHLPIAQRLAASTLADALRVEWRQLRDERNSA